MNVSPEQLFLQLGVVGAVLFVVWKLGSKWLDRQHESEKERTIAIADGFKAITTSLNNHSAADIASHERMVAAHHDTQQAVVRVEAKLDTLAEFTPVSQIPVPRQPTPPRGVPAGGYSYARPKTHGGG